MTTTAMSEEKMVFLVRNALLVAGQEMGNGDQWPVVKDTVYKIMKDWEDLKVERAVQDEMREHVYAQLDEMERILITCTAEEQADAAPKVKQLREIYNAYFEPIDETAQVLAEEDTPIHIKRAEKLLSTLEEDHDA